MGATPHLLTQPAGACANGQADAAKMRIAEAACALAAWLSSVTGKRVLVTWTKNRSTMLSYRNEASLIRLRLHVMFVQAQAEQLEAIAHYVRGKHRLAAPVIDAFIAAQMPNNRQRAPRRVGSALGRVYDLNQIFNDLNAAHFHDGCTACIMWGQAGGYTRVKRSIQLGCYVPEDNLIRLHPCLDQNFVPLFFITGVVFHEMLHEVLGVGGTGQPAARRLIHPPEFVAAEQSHPDYGRCQIWERQHLNRLLTWRP